METDLTPSSRIRRHQEEIADEAGPMLSAAEAADLLQISHQALEEWRQSALILGVRAGHEWRYPELQFQDGRPLPRLDETLAAHHNINSWVVLDSLMAPDSAHGGRSILGRDRQVVVRDRKCGCATFCHAAMLFAQSF
ncbi:helix-turn-helix domain-containing protein [Sulfitobacter sp. 915]|uniref:helix-turn-helix domain-containing protein n=1 Tax=Sulfitobacter sp. 915 TaxID=3368558 RepID=UPI003745B7A3